jgi:hypothetical protein
MVKDNLNKVNIMTPDLTKIITRGYPGAVNATWQSWCKYAENPVKRGGG